MKHEPAYNFARCDKLYALALGGEISTARKEHGLSREQLAADCNCSEPTITRLEQGKAYKVSAGLIQTICEYLGVEDPEKML